MGKSTDAEIATRVTDVYNLLLVGTSRPAILQYASKWGVSSRSVDTIIRRAKNEIRKHAAIDREEAMGSALARLEMLFQRALAAKDIRGALAVQKELNQLADLYPGPPLSLKALLAEGGVPVDLAFWSALFAGLKAVNLPALTVMKDLLEEVEKAKADGGN